MIIEYGSRRSRKMSRRRGLRLLLLIMGLMLIAGAWYAWSSHDRSIASDPPPVAPPAKQPPSGATSPSKSTEQPVQQEPQQTEPAPPIVAEAPSAEAPAVQPVTPPAGTPKTQARPTPPPTRQPPVGEPASSPAPAARPDLETTSLSIVSVDGLRYLTGVVKNNTATNYIYAQAELAFFDDTGFQVSTAMINTHKTGSKLEAFGEWHFRILLTDPRVVAGKVLSLTGS